MLESFISTQKNNVQRVLKKRFKRFMTHSRDANDLLLVELQELIRGQLRAYNAGLGAQDGLLRVQGRYAAPPHHPSALTYINSSITQSMTFHQRCCFFQMRGYA